jgi:hypothetical protein
MQCSDGVVRKGQFTHDGHQAGTIKASPPLAHAHEKARQAKCDLGIFLDMLFDFFAEAIKDKTTAFPREPMLAYLTMRACFECRPISVGKTLVPAIPLSWLNGAITFLAFVLLARLSLRGEAYGEPLAILNSAHLHRPQTWRTNQRLCRFTAPAAILRGGDQGARHLPILNSAR